MTETNIQTRQPSKMDYASPIQFRFKIAKLPLVEFFIQSVNLPGITLGSATVVNPLYDYPVPGDKITYQSLDISFLVDENLNNYKELHDWMIGLGFPQNHTQYADLVAAGKDRFPTSDVGVGTNPDTVVPQTVDDGASYSDATMTILNSKNIAKTEVRFHNVYPTQLGALAYDIKASDVNYLTVNATFNYMYYEIVQISTT